MRHRRNAQPQQKCANDRRRRGAATKAEIFKDFQNGRIDPRISNKRRGIRGNVRAGRRTGRNARRSRGKCARTTSSTPRDIWKRAPRFSASLRKCRRSPDKPKHTRPFPSHRSRCNMLRSICIDPNNLRTL